MKYEIISRNRHLPVKYWTTQKNVSDERLAEIAQQCANDWGEPVYARYNSDHVSAIFFQGALRDPEDLSVRIFKPEPDSTQINFWPVPLESGRALGPADLLESGELAAQAVHDWAVNPERTPEERDQADRFLQTWPQGPQLLFGLTEAAGLLGVTREALFYRIKRGHMLGQQIDGRWLVPWREIRDYQPIKPGRRPK